MSANRSQMLKCIQGTGTSARSLLLFHGNVLFAAERLHDCRMPSGAAILRLEVRCVTVEYGQKLFFGLLEVDGLSMKAGSAGLAVSVDPETGTVEDLHNDSGVIGYVASAPMQPGTEVRLAMSAWFYGRVVIPQLWVGAENVLHPALLMETDGRLSALAGGEITSGNSPRFDHAELTIETVGRSMPMHG
jgi:hypothetical protein